MIRDDLHNILEINNLNKDFDGVKAADSLSFEIKAGIITGLIGPNGSGKTTVFNILTGMLRPDSGKVFFKDKNITRMQAYKIAGMGMARTFQNVRLFPQVSVIENMLLGTPYEIGESLWSALLQSRAMKSEDKKNIEKAMNLLEKVGLANKRDELAMNLSHGQRRLLELARALATEADLYLLDEPTAGVFPETRIKIMEIIQELDRQNKAVLFIEHDMRVVMGISEKIIVLNHGQKIAEGTPQEVANDVKVVEAYLGSKRKVVNA